MSGLQKPLAYVISKRRAPKSKAAYASIGGGSPIVRYTREQVRRFAKANFTEYSCFCFSIFC